MSFKATLTIEGKTWRVFSCRYAFQQPTDSSGLPSSRVHGGTVELEVESTGDLSLAQWTLDPTMVKDGKITFYQRDGEQRLKEIEFKTAFMVSYVDSFSNFGDNAMVERVIISANQLTITSTPSSGGTVVEHRNLWPTNE